MRLGRIARGIAFLVLTAALAFRALVQSLSVGRDSAGKPILYVIGTDNQVYVHQFDGSDNSVGTYVLIPDLVKSIALTDGLSLQ